MDKEKMIEFAGEQCEIFPEDSYMGKYLRETLKMLQTELCEDVPDTNVGNKMQAEHCEDAVSRKDLERLKRWRFSYDTNTTIPKSDLFVRLTDIRALPPVKPAHKKGKWIDTTEISTNKRGQIVHEVICSECNGISYFRGMDGKYIGANFCPNCGAKMASG